MKNDNATVDHLAVKHPRNSLGGFDPEFEEPATHGAGVRHSQVWAKYLHSFRVPDKPREKPRRQSEDFRFDAVVEEGNGPSHDHSIAYALYPSEATLNDG